MEYKAKSCVLRKEQTRPRKLDMAPKHRSTPVPEVEQLLQSSLGGGKSEFTVLTDTKSDDYKAAFFPEVTKNDWYYSNMAYPSMWGDLGETWEKFGGLKNYSVVKIKANALKLYRMSPLYTAPDLRDHNCGIWWGFEPSYQNTMLEASKKVATCTAYSALTMCEVTGEVLAVVGQGGALSKHALLERGCASLTPDGDYVHTKEGGFVTEAYLKAAKISPETFGDAPADVLQVVVPACQLPISTCMTCPLKDTSKIQNLVKYMKDKMADKDVDDGCFDPMAPPPKAYSVWWQQALRKPPTEALLQSRIHR